MKRIVSIGFLTLTAFFMSGCDLVDDVDDLPIDLPGIELVGDTVMEVELGSDFVDPGAGILGDFDLDVTTVSDVDTSVLGDYTVTYTIAYLGIEYVVSRTVRVVEELSGESPLIELVGDSDIYIELYGEFTDPGALIPGDFEIDITVETNVDVNTVGDYTITYTFSYMEIEYSITRNVYVVEYAKPELVLIGDAVIELELYEYYVESGVNIIGDFDLEVTVDSTLDIGSIGEYVITYSVTYEDVVYSVTRAIFVVMPVASIDFNIFFNSGEVTETSITVNLTIDDKDGLLSNTYVVLYKDGKAVGQYEYIDGVNIIEFTGLEDNTWYRVELVGEYTEDGISKTIDGIYLDVLTLTLEELSVVITSYSCAANTDYIGCDIVYDITDLLNVTIWAELYKDGVFIESDLLDYLDTGFEFSSLDSNSVYTVMVYADYTYSGVENIDVLIATYTVTTLEEIIAPVLDVTSHSCEIDVDSVDCIFYLNSIGFNSLDLWAELYQGDTYIDYYYIAYDSYYDFYDLESSTEYTIYLYADYTYGGITYTDVLIGAYTVTTLEAEQINAPYVENMVITTTPDTITVEFDLVDVDSLMVHGLIRLYRESVFYSQNDIVVGHNSFTYDSNIYENRLYRVSIDIDYLDDGSYPSVYEESFYTPPVITLNSFDQTEMFFIGDHVIMELDINNNKDVNIDFVTINGIRYTIYKFPSDNEVLYVDMGVEIIEGTITMNLENVGITLGDEEYIIEMTSSTDVTIYVAGTIAPSDATVSILEIVPEDYYVVVDNDNPSAISSLNVSIYLDNEYNLPVSSITIGGITYTGGDLTVVSPTELLITADFSYESGNSSNTLYFSEILFTRNGSTVSDNQTTQNSVRVYKMWNFDWDNSTDEIIHITTPQEFMDMDGLSNKIYILDNDLDFTGINYIPLGACDDSFGSVFNGNGFTISNVTITRNLGENSDDKCIGLFGYVTGFIFNFNIYNMNINVTTTPDNGLYVGIVAGKQHNDVYNVNVLNSSIYINGINGGVVGGFAASSHGDLIRVSANTDITIIGANDDDSTSSLSVGGLTGEKYYDDIRSSWSSGDINITSTGDTTMYVGGISGFLYNNGSSNPNYVMNSYATGDISTTANYYSATGGLIGYTWIERYSSIILNSYASGDVYASTGEIGGLVGESWISIISSFSTGNVSSISRSPGRLFGTANDYALENIYAYDGQVISNDSGIVLGGDIYYNYIGVATWVQFNDEDYYMDLLGWSNYFFDFDNLDIANGVLPTLK